MDGASQASLFPLVPAAVLAALAHRDAAVALRFRKQSVTALTLYRKILALAAQLRQAGIGPHCRVGVCLDRDPALPVALLALWCCRAVHVPLDPSLPRRRLLSMAETAALQMLLTTASHSDLLASLPCPLLELAPIDFAVEADSGAAIRPEDTEPGDSACIFFTSGSSGIPKGVVISQHNLAALFAAIIPLLQLPPAPRILACAGFGFDISLFELLAPLLCGGTLVLADNETVQDPQGLVSLIDTEAVDVVQATPSRWQLLVRCAWPGPRRPLLALATGEALPKTLASMILAQADTLWNLYGPTECTLWSSAHCVGPADLLPAAPACVAIGTALPGWQLLLGGAGGLQHCESAAEGELLIAGAGVATGYCGNAGGEPAAFASQVVAGRLLRTYRSGDQARVDAAGQLHFLGRRDQQVKHNGHRIELDEISALLRSHASIAAAECLLRPATPEHPDLLFACVVFRPGLPNKDRQGLNRWLAASLPDWMLPQRYFFLPRLPITTNGKLDRAALLALARPQALLPAAADVLETKVARIFCEVLELETIGPCDSFLDAGGTSMQAATLLLALNRQLGCKLGLRQLLATPPTVASVVSLLHEQDYHAAP